MTMMMKMMMMMMMKVNFIYFISGFEKKLEFQLALGTSSS